MNLHFLIFACFIFSNSANEAPKVSIPLGEIQGTIQKSLNGRNIYSFEGIPFAKPPVGKLRFEEPEPAKPWLGTWQANTLYTCLQYNHITEPGHDMIIGTEDCLYLNVYTPKLEKDANLDVIVYIHGGAFNWGAGGYYGPEILLQRDVVYVTINYRLGPLGFLSTEDNVVPGNNGIKDQTLALKWVNKNIEYFGGNPKSITLYGMSAGGASVQTHYLSPISKGLFQRGFSQSGCIFNSWAIRENPLHHAKKVSASIGCPTENTKKMVECLRKRPGRQLVGATKILMPYLYNPFSPYGIVVDTWAKDPVLPDHPYNLIKNKKVQDLPWLTSHVTSEGLYPAFDFYDPEILKFLDENWNEIMPHILHYNFTVDIDSMDRVSSEIKSHYFGDKALDMSTFRQLVQLAGDRLFNVDLEKSSRLQASVTKSPVYHYTFDYRGKNSISDLRSGSKDDIGVCHADDTVYILNAYVDSQSTEEDRKMSKILLDMITSFAKTGTPSIGQEWTPISKNIFDNFTHLNIKSPNDISLESTPYLGDRPFWDSLPFKENDKLYTSSKDEL